MIRAYLIMIEWAPNKINKALADTLKGIMSCTFLKKLPQFSL